MPTFIALIDFTEQGMHAIKESPKRAAAATAKAEKAGLAVRQIYWTSGAHDGLLILDAPDEDAAAAFFLSLARGGNVRTSTLRAYDAGEFTALLEHVE